MIEKILNDNGLSSFIVENCCEEGVCVTFDSTVSSENYVIIKVDDFFNSLNLKKTPASVDCLVFQRCLDGSYGITLVELKSSSSSGFLAFETIKQKFQNTIDIFIIGKFPKYFFLDYKKFDLYFVSNIEIYKRDLGLKYETLINTKFMYNGKNRMIKPYMPTPTIKNCY